MQNIVNEIVLFLFGFFILYKLIYNKDFTKKYKIIFIVSYIIPCLIIIMSSNGAIFLTDGLDYLDIAQAALKYHNNRLNTFLDINYFITKGQNWHFIPSYEFAVFVYLFKSTKCISIFHVILMHLAAYIWYLILKNEFRRSMCERCSIFMLLSIYMLTFTISALKDPIVYFLITYISYILMNYDKKNIKNKHIILIVSFLILFFTRIYAAIAIGSSFLLILYIGSKKKFSFIIKIIIISLFLFIIFSLPFGNNILIYLNRWLGNFTSLDKLISYPILIIINMIEFYFTPIILNIGNAQSVYYASYIEAMIRTVFFPFFLRGLHKFLKHKNKKYLCKLLIVLIVPLCINIICLNVGEQDSPIRQFMWNYPIICLLLANGLE